VDGYDHASAATVPRLWEYGCAKPGFHQSQSDRAHSNPRDLREFLKEINQVKPAFICTVPTLLNGIMNHAMAREGKVDFTSIKLCFSGAAPLMAETKKRFEELTGGVIVEGYSLTEAQMPSSQTPSGPEENGSWECPYPMSHRHTQLGRRNHTSSDGRGGEIVISAPQLMQGYWQKPDETSDMLRTNDRGERRLYTGDLGYLRRDGYLFHRRSQERDLIRPAASRCGRADER